jgi:hypothetical protein
MQQIRNKGQHRHNITKRKSRVALNPRYATGRPHKCQCNIYCNRNAVSGQAFCKFHLKHCTTTSPLSGSEPDYDPHFWNYKMSLRETHNCFSYAMNIIDKSQIIKCRKKNCNIPFHQPGAYSGYRPFSNSRPKTCPNMLARILGDNNNLTISDFGSICPTGTSKIALILDESDDYHYLRQDSNGFWSHKPGSTKIKNVDAYDHLIWNPQLANYNYDEAGNSTLNYNIFCSYFCVPRNVKLNLAVDLN